MSKKLVIIGASELGSLVKYYAEDSGDYKVVGYYDDFKTKDTRLNGIKIIGTVNNVLNDFHSNIFEYLFIAIGYNHMDKRKYYFNQFKDSIPFPNIIHRSAYIDSSVKLGKGNIVFPGCVVDCFSELKDNILLNTGVSIAHHTTIQSHCFIAPGVSFAGRVNIGESCFIGIGSIITDLVNISKGCIIGGGSLVFNNTEPDQLLYGSPAKVIRKL